MTIKFNVWDIQTMNINRLRQIQFIQYCEILTVLPVWTGQFDGHDWRLTSLNTTSSRSCSFHPYKCVYSFVTLLRE